jgi:hypothetical protein
MAPLAQTEIAVTRDVIYKREPGHDLPLDVYGLLLAALAPRATSYLAVLGRGCAVIAQTREQVLRVAVTDRRLVVGSQAGIRAREQLDLVLPQIRSQPSGLTGP